ncbi:MAG: glycosyltransferase family 4 protein [Saonia sp.]
MKKKVCCIFNLAPHYRAPIYKLMDKELNCDFYFGNSVNTPIVKMNVEELKGYKKTLVRKTVSRWNYYWLSGSFSLIFKPYKYYIISGDSKYLSHWLISIAAIFLNKKVMIWGHGMKGNKLGKAKFLNKTYHRLCHKVLLYGEHSRNIMLKEGFRKNKLILIYNSLDHSKQLKVRTNLKPSKIFIDHFKNDSPVLIYIGRVQKSKRLDLLIESVKSIHGRGIPCNLVIIGKDVEQINLMDLVKKHNLGDNVWFYGPCYDEEEIGNLMYNADLCVSPGPIGLTALHAMTYGTPIITNNNFSKQMPEHEVVLKNITGDFYKENNLEDLTAKIVAWINLSKERRAQIRKDAYQVIDSKYNPNYQIKVLKELME